MNPPVAAIDIGTTSTNLLIRDVGGEIERQMKVTRLGDGVDRSRRLAPEAVERTLHVLRDYHRAISARGVDAVRIVATSACRDAENRDDIFGPIHELFGVVPELLSGIDEARLSFNGAVGGLSPTPNDDEVLAVIDIGGGSTELVVGKADGTLIGSASIDLGARRLTELDLAHDPPRPEELTNAIGRMVDELDDVVRSIPQLIEADRFVGVASTVTVVAAVELGLLTWQPEVLHGFSLTRDAAEDVFRTLATERLSARVHNPGLPADRADVIVGGCCALVGVMRRLHLAEITVSVTNLLDGVAAELVAAQR
jgi:exopolyphosphatase / guanosine-5'-triphosphate,3'-diphosphate pyrophosphatase